MDAKLTFLNEDFENKIFMCIPEEVSSKGGEVWLFHKILYGLKQTSRKWYLKLRGELKGIGFKQSKANYGVFTKVIDGKIFIIAMYVNNFLLFSGSIKKIKRIKTRLEKIFEIGLPRTRRGLGADQELRLLLYWPPAR